MKINQIWNNENFFYLHNLQKNSVFVKTNKLPVQKHVCLLENKAHLKLSNHKKSFNEISFQTKYPNVTAATFNHGQSQESQFWHYCEFSTPHFGKSRSLIKQTVKKIQFLVLQQIFLPCFFKEVLHNCASSDLQERDVWKGIFSCSFDISC